MAFSPVAIRIVSRAFSRLFVASSIRADYPRHWASQTSLGSFEETKPGDSRAARDFSPREPPPFRKRSGSAYSPNGRKGFRV